MQVEQNDQARPKPTALDHARNVAHLANPRNQYERRLDAAMQLIRAEVMRIYDKHGPAYNSFHELYGVLTEEYEEFWGEVKANNAPRAVMELVQTAAVAFRGVAQYMGMEVRTGGLHPRSTLDYKNMVRGLDDFARLSLAKDCGIYPPNFLAWVANDAQGDEITADEQATFIQRLPQLHPEFFN